MDYHVATASKAPLSKHDGGKPRDSEGDKKSESNFCALPEIIVNKKRDAEGREVVQGRYRRGRLLGKGGFAKCYKVTCLETNAIYAMKIVPKSTLAKRRAKEKLQTEIKIHSTLNHERIVRFNLFFEDRKYVYILLDLCPNQSMSEFIRRHDRLSEESARRYMLQMLDAMHYCHTFSVIHRDLKLGNLFLDRNLDIKVGDFGLAAKLSDNKERKRTVCGTPNYIAPEILEGSTGHSFQVDIWSLGVILYTMLVGRPPYESKDVKSTYRRILANVFSFPEDIVLSDSAKSLIRRMLQTTPDLRPSLEEILNHIFLRRNGSKRSFDSSSYRLSGAGIPQSKGLSSLCSEAVIQQPLTRQPLVQRLDNNYFLTSRSGCKALKSEGKKGNVLGEEKPHNVLGGSGQICDLAYHGTTRVKPRKELMSTPSLRSTVDLLPSSNSATPIKQPRKVCGKPLSPKQATQHTQLLQHSTENHGASTWSALRPVCEKAPAPTLPPPPPKKSNSCQRLKLDAVGRDNGGQRIDKVSETLKRVFEGEVNGVEMAMLLATDVSAPFVWVKKYVDYTSKYGLGFLLNNGSSCVYFNDATKMVMKAQDKGRFYFVERKSSSADINDPHPVEHSLDDFPEELTKKATLLKHFCNYLERYDASSSSGADVHERKDETDKRRGGDGEGTSAQADECPPYVRKWLRTKHAILFRLSDGTVQVVFFDQTELRLGQEGQVLSYINKKGKTDTMSVAVGVSRPDVAKRLKYTSDMLRYNFPASSNSDHTYFTLYPSQSGDSFQVDIELGKRLQEAGIYTDSRREYRGDVFVLESEWKGKKSISGEGIIRH